MGIGIEPHKIVDGAISVNSQREMHRNNRVLKVAVHDEIRVWQPYILVMMDRI